MPSSPGSAEARRPARVFLVGMMGAGKTTIGRRLARRLEWRHVDSDEQVQQATGRTVAEILRADGEAAFRSEEKRALAAAAASAPPLVVSVAGGAVLDPENRALLAERGVVIWLRAPLAELTRRVRDGHGRPLLGTDPATAMADLYSARREIYAEVADCVVENQGSPERVVDRIVDVLSDHGLVAGRQPKDGVSC